MWGLATWLLAACTTLPKQPIGMAVMLDGDRSAVGALPRTAVPGLELRTIELPDPAPAPVDDHAALLARARTAYARGNFEGCRSELAKVEVVQLLVDGNRSLAARQLALETACAWSSLARTDAANAAARIASFGLELPVAAVAPDVEQLIGDAIAAAGKAPRHPLVIHGEPGARVALDGRGAGCTVPCTLDVADGDHVIAVETDGFLPAARLVRAPQPKPVRLDQPPAPAVVAGRQWRARVGRGLPPTDEIGAGLIAKLSGARRITLVHGGPRLTGALIVDGQLRASMTRDRGEAGALIRELSYDAGVLQRPPVWQRPWFLIAVSGAALAIAGGIVAVTYQPEIQTSVRF